jgi:MFS transporter, BCD family, chlorophyll transporter
MIKSPGCLPRRECDVNKVSRNLMKSWIRFGPRFLPFADAATPDLPLSRLLRLSLIQVSVGMSLVLLVGTINRVMIVELGIKASIVSIMLCLPLVFAPLRALIGFKSDTHRSVLGWRRIPFIFRGTMIQFGGLAIMPFALLVLSGGGNAGAWPAWIGPAMAGLAFLLVGAGIHTTQTVGLALATDQALPESRPKVVGLMYVMLLLGTIVSALTFGVLLEHFSPGRLVQVIQGSAVVTIALNGIALWKQEPLRRAQPGQEVEAEPSFKEAWASYMQGGGALRRLAIIGLGTMAFGMQDVLLEPYGGEILHLTVSATTYLTATLAVGGLLGFGFASRILSRGGEAFRMAAAGAFVGALAFVAIIASAEVALPLLFKTAVFFLGLGGGLFSHGTLTATMNFAPKQQAGLALGAWGAVQATAGGIGIGLGGILRDVLMASRFGQSHGAAVGYNAVYSVEIILLIATLITLFPLVRRSNLSVSALSSANLSNR